MMHNDLPQWHPVYQQTHRWLKAGVFAMMVHDLRAAQGRQAEPSAAILDSRMLQSTPESGERKHGSRTHMAVDTLGYLLTLFVTPADEQDWAQAEQPAREVQVITGVSVELAFVDQGYTGKQPAEDAAMHGFQLEVISCSKPRKALCSCPGTGSNAPLPGLLVSVGWLTTMSDSQRLHKVCITRSSQSSCPDSSLNSWLKVHNTL